MRFGVAVAGPLWQCEWMPCTGPMRWIERGLRALGEDALEQQTAGRLVGAHRINGDRCTSYGGFGACCINLGRVRMGHPSMNCVAVVCSPARMQLRVHRIAAHAMVLRFLRHMPALAEDIGGYGTKVQVGCPNNASWRGTTRRRPVNPGVSCRQGRQRRQRQAQSRRSTEEGGGSGRRTWRPKRMGSWKSSWTVAHWNLRLRASYTVMSILGP